MAIKSDRAHSITPPATFKEERLDRMAGNWSVPENDSHGMDLSCFVEVLFVSKCKIRMKGRGDYNVQG